MKIREKLDFVTSFNKYEVLQQVYELQSPDFNAGLFISVSEGRNSSQISIDFGVLNMNPTNRLKIGNLTLTDKNTILVELSEDVDPSPNMILNIVANKDTLKGICLDLAVPSVSDGLYFQLYSEFKSIAGVWGSNPGNPCRPQRCLVAGVIEGDAT